MTNNQLKRLRSEFSRQRDDGVFLLLLAFFGIVGAVSLAAAAIDLLWSIH